MSCWQACVLLAVAGAALASNFVLGCAESCACDGVELLRVVLLG